MPLFWRAAYAVAISACLFWLVCAAVGVRYLMEPTAANVRILSESPWLLTPRDILAIVIWVAVQALLVFFMVRDILGVRRGSVVIDEQGMEVIDWRMRRRRVCWRDVESVHLRRIFVLRVTVHAGGLSIGISPWLAEGDAVVDEIVCRAQLGNRRESWLGTVYARC
jgi:hypothetical protein